MKKETKVSLAQSKIAVKKAVISFTAIQSKKVDDVISIIETIIDMNEGFTVDKAQKIALIVDYIIEALGSTPSRALWDKIHNDILSAVTLSRGIDEKSFASNYWTLIIKGLNAKGYSKQESQSPDALAKAKRRAERDAKPDSELTRVELAQRLDARDKAKNDLKIKRQKELVKENKEWFEKRVFPNEALTAYIKNNIIDLETLSIKE
jgi:hypothetical protein